MRLSFTPGRIALALVLLTWVFLAATLPTFDFDESLYRRVAESMREAGDPWKMVWDGQNLFHKPPIFYWLIWGASAIADFASTRISALAARIPSLLSSLLILWGLHQGMRVLFPELKKESIRLAPVFAFLCALFPLLTGISVIFDPLQTLALVPAILIPTRMFLRDELPGRLLWLSMGASLAAATMVKGLNGIVIPSFALAVHLALHFRSWGLRKTVRAGLGFLFWAFLPSIAISGAFFTLLHLKIGPEFTREFFLVQHFGRGTNPMEAHGGSPLYHFITVIFGGGFLTPLLIYLAWERRPSLLRHGFPLVFALSFMTIFGLSATKLPHYTWPVWPALALFAGILCTLPEPDSPRILDRRIGLLASIPVLLVGTALLVLAIAPELLFGALNENPVARSLIARLEPFTGLEKLCLLIGSASCWAFLIQKSRMARSPALAALSATIAFAAIALGLSGGARRLLSDPFFEMASALKELRPAPEDCIRYGGPYSATLSLALAPELVHNRCEPSTLRFLIMPEWKEHDCEAAGLKTILRRSYLLLCEKSPTQAQ